MKHYITFGQKHTHFKNGKLFDKDCVCIIHADTSQEAYDIASKTFGNKYCFLYTEKLWNEKNLMHYKGGYRDLNKEEYQNA